MKRVVIFSGTTEGRILSEHLSADKIPHTVCVATEYGAEMMEENSYAKVHVGRMDASEIRAFLAASKDFNNEKNLSQGIDLTGTNVSFTTDNVEEMTVVDATHPYATEVTANIKEAADTLGIRYIRVIRDMAKELPKTANIYSDISECAKKIDESCGNIMLTTGSKELAKYCENVSENTKKRTYVRVLPSAESLKLCEEQSIEPDHIIAMHGPFSRELNEALIRQYDIKHLITKESGTSGGFQEKVEAAANCGASIHVIKRPTQEIGMSLEEAYSALTGKESVGNAEYDKKIEASEVSGNSLKIYLVGIGMGAATSMTVDAETAIEDSDVVFGAERLIRDITCHNKFSMYRAADIIPVLEKENYKKVTILFSGDTGFYSGARKMLDSLKEWRKDIDVQVIPGISSYSYLAARLGESYDDAVLFSIHGKNTEKDIATLVDKIRYNSKVFTLLSGAKDVREIGNRLKADGITCRIYAGSNLSYDNETVRELSVEEALSFDDEGVVTALVKNTNPLKRPIINVRKDSDFIRDKVPMTKECIRHESIIRLGLHEGDVFYDIGGGTGSVAIEAASLHPSLQVYTFEKKKEAAELIRRNIEKLGTFNVTVVEGNAEKTIADMPKPDCVFIGGSSGKMAEIIDTLHSKGVGIRFVINAVSLETIDETRKIIEKYKHSDEETIVITVSDVKEIGSHHMLQGQNPIWIFSFTI
ncbi:bifunctional cobalt-precorrin-7 (C(5))-methyltransferase/cobalt-precorrin-6B (C(15))-methyltransferase [Butyrivibrio sp. VCB2006]|uniref:bifunctional cobalt-precorrin-7 (C(5))-methyltransferase/cobalt-precorrin-6B (C(15))-methyltransferase n=1 Tax=Butyrivibrio sp. VCB2006 TaxID=1280679 RepID=UPI000415DDDF|nr:bifunctional cobalt-precorrin-7 (C(5))-methyltransferase/cobalt-precorrin-6B (C(15))-methyltransferase [Butyrivibrio sp. VCB2006]